ncbi:MAG: YARHG domain-containing protein [Aestuariivirgaceae bacterium]
MSQAQAKELSCQNLWLVRNTIFHQRGYCFRSARGRAEFDNSRCSVNSIAKLRLSLVEKANIATLRKLERSKRCW